MPELLDQHPWLLAPAIFLLRIVDVSLGTFRSIVVFRGYPAIAAVIGFVEVLIWVTAVGQVLRQMNAWPLVIAYAGGFACGNYLGVWLEAKAAMGHELLRIISFRQTGDLAHRLRCEGHQVIELDGEVEGRPAEVLLVTAGRRQMRELLRTVRDADPEAIYTVSDIKPVRGGGATPRRWPLVPTGWRIRGKRK
ncbi:MAG: DUF5698 domain-containing protein [Gammaproteobacteria bacterium]|jgi:uncharacterized protein YebE (UPF0316 family)|nr:DUF5698 domain-containing protein [Gammaproteobacteria bacterium]